MNEAIVDYAAQCYGVTREELTPLSGGTWNAVYGFTRENQEYVVRITPEQVDWDLQRGMVEWVRFLSEHDAPVAGPVLSVNGRLIELCQSEDKCYTITASEKAEGILAEELPLDQWSGQLFQAIGRAVGKMHALAKAYVPEDPALKRPEWDAIDNCFTAGKRLDSTEPALVAKYQNLVDYLRALPKDRATYGLIHGDLHFANLCVEPDTGRVTIFDFDDCAYGWFVMDTALMLFDLLVLYGGRDSDTFGTRFLESYLKGYMTENAIDSFSIKQLPHFLKLLELSIYAQLYKRYDPNDADSWVGKFMLNRRARIENDLPYTGMNFEELARPSYPDL